MPDPTPISLVASDGFIGLADFVPPPAAAEALTSGMSVTEALTVIEEAQLGPESVELISQALDTPTNVQWGIESGQMAADKLLPADAEALASAQTIMSAGEALADPAKAEEAGAAAADAAQSAGFAGPGAFVAQAIAFAAPAGALAAAGTASPALVAHAIAGAVMLSAGALAEKLPPPTKVAELKTAENPEVFEAATAAALAPVEPPPPAAESFELLKPFIDLGKKLAGGPK
ncbi:hypothetical protein OT109_15575 [Phycisphaeraceae bacterium D3-23]